MYGRKQREYLTKDETSVPTVATEVLLLTCLINYIEHRQVATVNIPSAFMQADMEDEMAPMKIEGKIVEILAKLPPKLYRKYIQT